MNRHSSPLLICLSLASASIPGEFLPVELMASPSRERNTDFDSQSSSSIVYRTCTPDASCDMGQDSRPISCPVPLPDSFLTVRLTSSTSPFRRHAPECEGLLVDANDVLPIDALMFAHVPRETGLLIQVLADLSQAVAWSGSSIKLFPSGSAVVIERQMAEIGDLAEAVDLTTGMEYVTMTLDVYSPDVLFVGQRVGCRFLNRALLYHSAIKRIVIPFSIAHLPHETFDTEGGECSLSSLHRYLGRWYDLISLRPDGYAVFKYRFNTPPASMSIESQWMVGWYCDVRSARDHLATLPTEWMYASKPKYPYLTHAHCFESKCDCLFPFRGARCQFTDPLSSAKTVVYFLTSNRRDSLEGLQFALLNLAKSLPDMKLPVIVFYDSLISDDTRAGLVRGSELHVWFVSQFFDLHTPMDAVFLGSHYRSPGYRQVCRFEAGPVFSHPAMRGFQYTIRLDTDGYFPRAEKGFPFSAVREPHASPLMYSCLIEVPGNRLNGLIDAAKLFIGQHHGDQHQLMQRLNSLLYADRNAFTSINNPPYVFANDFFRSPQYQSWFKFVDEIGIYEKGFLGNAVITIGAVLFGSMQHLSGIAWAHGPHCSCPGSVCIPSESGKWTCSQ